MGLEPSQTVWENGGIKPFKSVASLPDQRACMQLCIVLRHLSLAILLPCSPLAPAPDVHYSDPALDAFAIPQGRTESGGIVLAANAGPRVPSGGVTLKRRCTYRPSVIYLIIN